MVFLCLMILFCFSGEQKKKPSRMTGMNYHTWRMGRVKTIGYFTFCLALVGFIMLLAGAIISGIAFTEVRPNIADENYERYIRSDLKRVMGPIILSFGLLCIISGCVCFGCSLCSAARDSKRLQKGKKYRQQAQFGPPTPDAEKKMLSDV